MASVTPGDQLKERRARSKKIAFIDVVGCGVVLILPLVHLATTVPHFLNLDTQNAALIGEGMKELYDPQHSDSSLKWFETFQAEKECIQACVDGFWEAYDEHIFRDCYLECALDETEEAIDILDCALPIEIYLDEWNEGVCNGSDYRITIHTLHLGYARDIEETNGNTIVSTLSRPVLSICNNSSSWDCPISEQVIMDGWMQLLSSDDLPPESMAVGHLIDEFFELDATATGG